MSATTPTEKIKRTSVRRLCRTTMFVMLALANASCAHMQAYVEPSEADGPVSLLQADAPVWITAIDGQKTSHKNKGMDDHKEFKVRPGPHVLEISLSGFETIEVTENGRAFLERRSFQSMGAAKMKIVAAPGESYLIGHKREPMGYHDVTRKWRPVIHAFQPFPANSK